MEIQYFIGDPPSPDKMWCAEVLSVWNWCSEGRGADIGSGGRTLTPDTIRVDSNPLVAADYQADACALPFTDGELDWLYSGHTIEHLPDPLAALLEWLRCVRVSGHVCVVVPNTAFTLGQNTDPTPHLHEWTPREFVAEVFGWDDKNLPWYEARCGIGNGHVLGEIIHADEACRSWSFCVVLERKA